MFFTQFLLILFLPKVLSGIVTIFLECWNMWYCTHRKGTGKWNCAKRVVLMVIHLTYHIHDDVIKWKHFPRYWPFVRGIHRSPVNSLHKSQSRRALMFSLICAWINDWVNNGKAGGLRRRPAHCDVTVMFPGNNYRFNQSGAKLLTHIGYRNHHL